MGLRAILGKAVGVGSISAQSKGMCLHVFDDGSFAHIERPIKRGKFVDEKAGKWWPAAPSLRRNFYGGEGQRSGKVTLTCDRDCVLLVPTHPYNEKDLPPRGLGLSSPYFKPDAEAACYDAETKNRKASVLDKIIMFLGATLMVEVLMWAWAFYSARSVKHAALLPVALAFAAVVESEELRRWLEDGKVKVVRANAYCIYPTKHQYEYIEEQIALSVTRRNDDRKYMLLQWDVKEQKLVEFVLPDKVNYQRPELVNIPLAMPANHKVFRRRESMLKQVTPMILLGGIAVVGILMVMTLG